MRPRVPAPQFQLNKLEHYQFSGCYGQREDTQIIDAQVLFPLLEEGRQNEDTAHDILATLLLMMRS